MASVRVLVLVLVLVCVFQYMALHGGGVVIVVKCAVLSTVHVCRDFSGNGISHPISFVSTLSVRARRYLCACVPRIFITPSSESRHSAFQLVIVQLRLAVCV